MTRMILTDAQWRRIIPRGGMQAEVRQLAPAELLKALNPNLDV